MTLKQDRVSLVAQYISEGLSPEQAVAAARASEEYVMGSGEARNSTPHTPISMQKPEPRTMPEVRTQLTPVKIALRNGAIPSRSVGYCGKSPLPYRAEMDTRNKHYTPDQLKQIGTPLTNGVGHQEVARLLGRTTKAIKAMHARGKIPNAPPYIPHEMMSLASKIGHLNRAQRRTSGSAGSES